MKPKNFNLQVNEEHLFRLQEQKLAFLRERTTRLAYVKVDGERQAIVPVLSYRCFDAYDEIVTGFSTRLGGVSKAYLGSMNLSFTRGDEPERVMENHRRFAKAVGYDYSKLVFSDQVHDTKIRIVTEEDAGKGIMRNRDFSGIDGLVTDVPGIPLMTFYADCVPLFFYDPVKRVVATAHSGWRGTVAGIGTKMIETMHENYGSKPENIVCAIGPSICRDCYEVSEDVAEAFRAVYTEDETASILTDKKDGKYQLDLHGACYYNFLKAGVLPSHIALPDLCTCCNKEMFFSHRATNGKRGNLGAVIMLKEENDREKI